MDERQIKLGLKACAATIAVAYIYLLVEAFYKFLSTKNIENCSWEIGLLVLIPFTILFVGRKDEQILLPKKVSGEELPIELTKDSKKERVKNYLVNSIGFSIGMICISFIVAFVGKMPLDFYFPIAGVSSVVNIALNCFIEFAVLFIISFLVDYNYGEYQVRSYNRKLKDLED